MCACNVRINNRCGCAMDCDKKDGWTLCELWVGRVVGAWAARDRWHCRVDVLVCHGVADRRWLRPLKACCYSMSFIRKPWVGRVDV